MVNHSYGLCLSLQVGQGLLIASQTPVARVQSGAEPTHMLQHKSGNCSTDGSQVMCCQKREHVLSCKSAFLPELALLLIVLLGSLSEGIRAAQIAVHGSCVCCALTSIVTTSKYRLYKKSL